MINSVKHRVSLFRGALLFIFSLPCLAATPSWIHEISTAANPRAGAFRIRTAAQEDDHLVGSATYHEVGHDIELRVEGIETLDGRFWPNVVVEGANDVDGPWERLKRADIPGRAKTLSCRFAQANPILYVNLDPFRSEGGKMRYGRISLPNGDDTIFALTEILPRSATEDEIEDEWELPTLHGYLADPLGEGPFFISGLSFSGGHLRALAGYVDPDAKSPTTIEGTRTPKKFSSEEEFWASATLQVSNDPKGEWKTVGQSATPGTSAIITIETADKFVTNFSVGIDTLRPMIGKYGYGRAVLRNGKTAAFELFDLLPPKDRR
jgi:hypothetical protein